MGAQWKAKGKAQAADARGKLFGRHKIAPSLSPSKTVEGLVGGVLSSTAVGAALWSITPFNPWQAALIALTINIPFCAPSTS